MTEKDLPIDHGIPRRRSMPEMFDRESSEEPLVRRRRSFIKAEEMEGDAYLLDVEASNSFDYGSPSRSSLKSVSGYVQ